MDLILQALMALLEPTSVMLVIIGAIIGIIFGALPGLSGGMAVMLLMPMTFGMSANLGIAFLIAVWTGGVSGSYIASILIGIPGSQSSIATCYDGYPMTLKGEAVRALSAGTVANFMGTIPSAVIAMFASPLIANWAVSLGPWEYFSLCFCAIVLIVSLSKDNIFKGFAASAIGLLIACVGRAPVDGYSRFTFGNYDLSGGFDLVPVMLGVFAARIILIEYARGRQYDQQVHTKVTGFKWPGKDIKDNWVNIIRSYMIGLWIGFLPGMGAALANVVSYAQAKSSSKHPEKFGTGIVDGVFAPEVANNASIGGDLVPMVALGIPGDGTTAILLGGLLIHGIQAGPLMFTNHPVFVYVMFLTVILAAIFILAIEVFGMRLFPTILKTPYHYLYPAILVLCFVGAFSSTNTIFNVFMTLCFTLLGVFMAYAELPVSPFILCFILGPMLELNLRKGISYADNGFMSFLTRPVSAFFLFVALLSVFWPLIKDYRKNKTKDRAAA